MTRVVVVQYRHSPDIEWWVWGVYDSVPTMRASVARIGMVVPTALSGAPRYPWRWTNEWGGEYRACKVGLEVAR